MTLNEYAPSVLGEAVFADRKLMPTTSGFYPDYSSTNRGGAIDAVVLTALQALTSLKRSESPDLEQQVILAAKRISLDIAEHDEPSQWNPSALLIHTARDYGLAGYTKFVEYCSNGSVKVSISYTFH